MKLRIKLLIAVLAIAFCNSNLHSMSLIRSFNNQPIRNKVLLFGVFAVGLKCSKDIYKGVSDYKNIVNEYTMAAGSMCDVTPAQEDAAGQELNKRSRIEVIVALVTASFRGH